MELFNIRPGHDGAPARIEPKSAPQQAPTRPDSPTRGAGGATRTAKRGLLEWLLACAAYAERSGRPCVIRNTTIHVKAKRWLVEHGYKSYSAENLTRRWREIREDGDADYAGISVTPIDTPGAEQSWHIQRKP